MAEIQKYLEEFNDAIRLKGYEENSTLREKRDIILDKLKDGIKSYFKEKDENPPQYVTFNQGSYKLGTGIKPLDGDYDIDVGIKFNISISDYKDPVVVKKWVYESLKNHTKKVEIRRPCVTVDRKSTRLNSSHIPLSRMPSSA